MSIYDEVRPQTVEEDRRDQQRQRALNHEQFKQGQQNKARIAERQKRASPRTEIEELRDEVLLLRTRVASLEIHSKQ